MELVGSGFQLGLLLVEVVGQPRGVVARLLRLLRGGAGSGGGIGQRVKGFRVVLRQRVQHGGALEEVGGRLAGQDRGQLAHRGALVGGSG